MKKFTLCTLILLFLFWGTNAFATGYGFIDIPSDNDNIDIADAFSIDVVADSTNKTVKITVNNSDSNGSFITGVYFDLGDLLAFIPETELPKGPYSTVGTVNLTSDDNADIPQGNEIGFDADLAYLATMNKSAGILKKDAGIDNTESATFVFNVAGSDFNAVLDALSSVRVGIHVQGIEGDEYNADSDSYYASVPESATMLLLGAGLIGIAGLGRKKLFKKK